MKPLRVVPTRLDLPALLNELELVGYGAEIGVYTGHFSRHILHHWKGDKLYLVDPWWNQRDYCDSARCDEATGTARLDETIRNVLDYTGRWEIVREHSPEAAKQFADGSLDFVYIDGNHSYKAAKADIHAWQPKIAPGGVMIGHDYFDAIGDDRSWDPIRFLTEPAENPETLTTFGVRAAVDEYVRQTGVQLFLTSNDGTSPSWYFRL